MSPGLVERLLMKVLPYTEICKTVNGERVVYMRRFFLRRSRNWSVFLHHILRSDDDPDPHDHPFDFTSVILSKGYTDEQWYFVPTFKGVNVGEKSLDQLAKHVQSGNTSPPLTLTNFSYTGWLHKGMNDLVKPFTIVRRQAEHLHRVLLTNGPCWTLVFTGKYRRSWGFARPMSWIYWRAYLNNWEQYDAD